MNFTRNNKTYAEKILLAANILFLVSLSLELEVNLFRTFFLVALISYLFVNRSVIKEIFSSDLLKVALLFPFIALSAWLIGPYESNWLKTFDWLVYIIFGITSTLLWKEKSIFLLIIIPATCIIASLLTIFLVKTNIIDTIHIYLGTDRLRLYMDSTSRFGILCTIASSICIGISFIRDRWAIPLLLMALGLSYASWLTQSRAAVFAMSGVIFFSICYAFKKNKKSTLTFALLGLVITLLVAEAFIIKGRILSTLTSLDFAFLLNGRDDIWLAAWEIFQKSPLVGHGVNSFHDALGAHLALPENADRFHIIRSQYTFWNAHQMILGILCETGLAGLGVFCVIIFKGFKSAIRNFPETLPPFLILTAFLIHGIGGYGFHRSWNAALFFLPLGILEGWKMSNGIEK